ncbi:MAG: NAD-dependent epimerase/dehydratase family protein [Planctomycetota bacterium]|jgi:UDP-apiose/xylose synthase
MSDETKQTLCVLGCAGFIGSHLLDRVLADGKWRVLGVDRTSRKIEGHLDNPDLEYHEFDIEDVDRVFELIDRSDAVVHLAALCNPSLYNTTTLEVIRSNFMDALPIVERCREKDKHLVHFSTCEVYGRTLAGYAPEGSEFREDLANYLLSEATAPMVLGPLHRERWSYAASKQLLERVIHAEGRENGLRWTIVRPFNFIGPRMDFIPGVDGEGLPRVLACYLEALLNGKPLQLVDGGDARRTFIYIEDAVDALVRMLDRPEQSVGKVFNVGHPANETTIAELAGRMIRIWEEVSGEGRKHVTEDVDSLVFYGEGYEDSDRRVPDITLAREHLEWEPRTTLEQTLRLTVSDFIKTYGVMKP